MVAHCRQKLLRLHLFKHAILVIAKRPLNAMVGVSMIIDAIQDDGGIDLYR